ncbi:MAG: hypothetical protein LBC94_05905 [Desulfovibrio sp.]|jgi:hypothetical protein|nr:hypothetical protein [Desulfovibrio sp.]
MMKFFPRQWPVGIGFVFPLLLAVLAACVPPRHSGLRVRPPVETASSKGASLPRADPAYLQWLERQSMLRAASQLTADISGTQILWRNSAAASRPDMLLEAAPNWFEINPHLAVAERPLFAALAESGFPPFLSALGFTGLYIAPSGERADIWSASPEPDGANVVSPYFDHALGGDEDFERMAEGLEKSGIQLGGELPPAATGLGPDFMLQARRVSRFDGIYAMTPVPQKYWEKLPASSSEWDCRPLSPALAAGFADEGLLPARLTRDSLPWASEGGWAVTGEVPGADGQRRRWLYRYNGNVSRPVLLWQDPSGNARRIFSAAAIRHTGMQRQALAGIRVEPLMGLDARQDADKGPPREPAVSSTPSERQWAELTPGPEAIDDTGREVHRYGGWLMQADVLPQALTGRVLGGAADFTRDASVWPAVVYALLSADAAPLAATLRASMALGVEHRRLARGLQEGYYVDWRAFLEMPDGAELVQRARQLAGGSAEDSRLRTTIASLAARALQLDEKQALRPENAPAMRRAALSLLSWRMGLPGLVFVSPQDLTGMLSFEASGGRGGGAVPLWGVNGLSKLGVSGENLVFGPLQDQAANGASFSRVVGKLLLARQAAGLHRGALRAVMAGSAGCIAVANKLPDGRHWLLATNFSKARRDFSVKLSGEMEGKSARDVCSGEVLPVRGNRLELSLEGHQSRHLLIF